MKDKNPEIELEIQIEELEAKTAPDDDAWTAIAAPTARENVTVWGNRGNRGQ